MVEQQLEQLGYSSRESGVYVALLRLGEASATELIKVLGWHRQLVYNALERLQREGLASSSYDGPKQRFRPAPPVKILARVRDSYDLAKDILPQLEQLQSKVASEQFAQVHQGLSGVQFVHEDILRVLGEGDIVRTLGASGSEYGVVMGDYHTKWTQKRLKKKIQLRLLAFETERAAMDELFVGAWHMTTARYLPTSYRAPTSTKIYGNKIAIQIWNPAKPIIILVESAKVARNYRQYFDFLWKLAKK